MAFRRLMLCFVLACSLCCSRSQAPSRYAVIIDELFPDPSPAVSLPASEFIELKNVSAIACDLQGCTISDGSSTAAIRVHFVLQPDSFVLICPASAAAAYAMYGPAIGVSDFPSLNNDGDTILLRSPDNLLLHAVAYDKSWYRNSIKSNGGWTLEMIDTRNPCNGGGNWKASTDPRGGTPAQKNSVDGTNADLQPPSLLRTYASDSVTIVAFFDEPLDSAGSSLPGNYSIDNGIGVPVSAAADPPLFNEVELKLASGMKPRTVYQLTVTNVADCSGNSIGVNNTARTGLPSSADSMDIVINEILFNPKPNGHDYVELYNRSDKIIDFRKLYVAGRNITGDLTGIKQLSVSPLLFFPGEYYVLTEDRASLNQNYMVENPDKVITLSLPSLPDDAGDMVLLNAEGNIVDELKYDHQWQFALIDNEQGVALERINYDRPTQDPANWTSAAYTVGFGTPTYRNSAFAPEQAASGEISILPKIFSPDNDGYEDDCLVSYRMPGAGYAGSITVFDAAGRPVRYLARNVLLSTAGNFRWDGLGDNGQKLPIGIYVILTEIYNPDGHTKRFRNTVVLAGKP